MKKDILISIGIVLGLLFMSKFPVFVLSLIILGFPILFAVLIALMIAKLVRGKYHG